MLFRSYDGDGEVEDEADEYAGVKDRAIKQAMKEDRDISSKRNNNRKLDTKKSVSNKIEINPSIKESNSTMNPPKGDAQTVQATDANKTKVAQMQIAKELADVRLAKAKKDAKQTTNESVIAYLYNRYNLSE